MMTGVSVHCTSPDVSSGGYGAKHRWDTAWAQPTCLCQCGMLWHVVACSKIDAN